jgi:RNA polymerase sigma factor (sigma-70 family)
VEWGAPTVLYVETDTANGVDGNTVHQHNVAQKRQWEEFKTAAAAHRAEGSEVLAARCERQMRRIEEDIIRRNRGLTVGVARRFATGRAASDGDDYVAVSAAALWKAFLEWAPSKGTLATFAIPYMKGAVQRQVHKSEAHEISYGDWSATPKIKTAVAAWERKHGSAPSIPEIAEITGETTTLVERVMMHRPASLDAPVGDGESKRSDVVIPDSIDVHEKAFGDVEDPFELVEAAAGSLDDRELFVMLRRHGLDGGRTQSLNEIGQLIGTSREAVRRSETKAEKAIRHALS